MERRIDVGIFMVVLDVIFKMYFGYGYYRGSFMDFLQLQNVQFVVIIPEVAYVFQ